MRSDQKKYHEVDHFKEERRRSVNQEQKQKLVVCQNKSLSDAEASKSKRSSGQAMWEGLHIFGPTKKEVSRKKVCGVYMLTANGASPRSCMSAPRNEVTRSRSE